MRIQEKKGAAIVEAAMIYPLIMLAVLVILYLSMQLYRQACFGSAEHMELREAGGAASETIFKDGLLPIKTNGSTGSMISQRMDRKLKEDIMDRLTKNPACPMAAKIQVNIQNVGVFPKWSVSLDQKSGGFWLIQDRALFQLESSISLQNEARVLRNARLVSEGGALLESQ